MFWVSQKHQTVSEMKQHFKAKWKNINTGRYIPGPWEFRLLISVWIQHFVDEHCVIQYTTLQSCWKWCIGHGCNYHHIQTVMININFHGHGMHLPVLKFFHFNAISLQEHQVFLAHPYFCIMFNFLSSLMCASENSLSQWPQSTMQTESRITITQIHSEMLLRYMVLCRLRTQIVVFVHHNRINLWPNKNTTKTNATCIIKQRNLMKQSNTHCM